MAKQTIEEAVAKINKLKKEEEELTQNGIICIIGSVIDREFVVSDSCETYLFQNDAELREHLDCLTTTDDAEVDEIHYKIINNNYEGWHYCDIYKYAEDMLEEHDLNLEDEVDIITFLELLENISYSPLFLLKEAV